MSDVGQRERPVQDRVVLLFTGRLGYRYLGNRLDGEDKEYGYIVDLKDLFNSLEGPQPTIRERPSKSTTKRTSPACSRTGSRRDARGCWRGNRFKEREVFSAVHEELGQYATRADEIFEINKSQREY